MTDISFEAFKQKCEKRGLVGTFTLVCRAHGIRLQDVFGRGRSKSLARARAECWAYTRRLGWSFPEIGNLWMRDHTTIMSATRKLKGSMAEEESKPPETRDDFVNALRGAGVEGLIRERTRIDDLERRVARLEAKLRGLSS